MTLPSDRAWQARITPEALSSSVLEPAQPPASNYLVVKSTYGDRRHEKLDPEQKLSGIITETAARGGTVLVPAFAVGRA